MTETPEVMPHVLLAEGNVKLLIGAPVVPGLAFDPVAFAEDEGTKKMIESARPLLDLIAANADQNPDDLLTALAPHFDPRAQITVLHSGADTDDQAVRAVVIPVTNPPKLTLAYDPVKKEFWVADSPTLVRYVRQSRGLDAAPNLVPRDVADVAQEATENLPAWIARAQSLCGFTDAEKDYFKTLHFEGPALPILIKVLKRIITSADGDDSDPEVCEECGATADDEAESLEGDWHLASCSLYRPPPYDISYSTHPPDAQYPQGRCLIHPNGQKGGQWIYKNLTTNVSDTHYYNLEGGLERLEQMREDGLVVIENNSV